MNRGYIKLWRRSFDSAVWKNPKLWRFWTYCLLKATHKPIDLMVGFQRVHLEQGQFIFGRGTAAQDTGLSEQNIRTCLRALAARDSPKSDEKVDAQSTGEITIKENRSKGDGGFGFDPIFRPDESDKTFAEMSIAEKNKHSHRAMALRRFAEWYKKLPKSKQPGDNSNAIT